MLGFLIIIFLMLPFIDLYLLIQITEQIGFPNTILLVLATGGVGAAILQKEGRQVLRKFQTSVTPKEISRNLLETVLLVAGGLMLLSPGLITDALGLLFVVNPFRQHITLYLAEKLEKKANFHIEAQPL
jgi:UPF0716 protein FxsA